MKRKLRLPLRLPGVAKTVIDLTRDDSASDVSIVDLTSIEDALSLSSHDTPSKSAQGAKKKRKISNKAFGERQSRNLVDEALQDGTVLLETSRALLNIPDLPLARQQLNTLKKIGGRGPRFLGRCSTATAIGNGLWQKKSNGLTTESRMLPGAACNEEHNCH